MKRKTPIRHRVKKHTRKGKSVTSYERGCGKQKPKITKRRISKGKTPTGPKPYTINFKYSEKKEDGESLIVIATSYERALAEGWEERIDTREPIEIEIIDPDFGRIFRAIGSGLKRVGHVGAKYAIKGGHIAKQAMIASRPHIAKGLRAGAKGTRRLTELGYKGIKVTGKAAATSLVTVAHDVVATQLVKEAYSPDRVKRTMARARLRKSFPDVWDVMDISRPTRRYY